MGKNNPTVFNTRDKKDILITNFPEHSPIIRFDGAGGLSMNRVVRVEIKGLEIIGTYVVDTLELLHDGLDMIYTIPHVVHHILRNIYEAK